MAVVLAGTLLGSASLNNWGQGIVSPITPNPVKHTDIFVKSINNWGIPLLNIATFNPVSYSTVNSNFYYKPTTYFQGWNGSSMVYWSSLDQEYIPGGVLHAWSLATL